MDWRYELFLRCPAVFQADNAIEYQRAGLTVFLVGDEVAMTLELEMRFGRGVGQTAFHEALAGVFGVGVERGEEIFAARIGVRIVEQAIVHADFARDGRCVGQPVDVAFDFVVVRAFGAAF